MNMAVLRCAIYTRKSTDDGLDMEFNSLDAQHEACAAYIASQRHEGWRALPDRFDDGGYSGGDMERPALRRLLEAVQERRVDVIVVYKVDRLTRALSDFARIVNLLDERQASFVSVTQQFNTTTSMGRLTLNVLLSFAQFEREVTAERIRDKIAASKKRGMWTGGPPPLGYDVVDKKLVLNDAEAAKVRRLYELYLDLGSVRALGEAALAEGIVAKLRVTRDGKVFGGKPFTRGALYRLLSNPLYVGRIAHRGETYEGRHPPLLDQQLWDAVQDRLKANAQTRAASVNLKSSSLLAGIVFDDAGDRLTPTHANKKGRRYRYYVSHRLVGADRPEAGGWRLPAKMLEDAVLSILSANLADPTAVLGAGASGDLEHRDISALIDAVDQARLRLASPDANLRGGVARSLIARIDLGADRIRIHLRLAAFTGDAIDETTIVVEEAIQLRRRGVEARFVLGSSDGSKSKPDANLIRLISRAQRWRDSLAAGEHARIADIAAADGVARSDVSRQLPLAFLAPDIVEAILEGRQPPALTANWLLKDGLPLPLCWKRQRQALGFSN